MIAERDIAETKAPTPLERSTDADSSPSQPLGVLIVLLLSVIFFTDFITSENLHAGVLFNVCIALTLWSWRPRWVVGVTAASIMLRLIAHAFDPTVHNTSHFVDFFNLTVGIAVQALSGTLIWRHIHVQKHLEARQQELHRQARALSAALEEARRATREAEAAAAREHLAAEREHAARLSEMETRRRERRMFRDLERVKGLSVALHRAVLPEIPSQVAEGRLELSARYQPAERQMEIGGDFYDLFALDPDGTRYGLVIGDVAGHGVDAAAQTALVTTTLRTCVFESNDGPAQILARTARALEGQLESFVSAVYAVYDTSDRTLTWANAGHEPPILLSADGSRLTALSPTGSLLGIGLTEFSQSRVTLEPGHVLVMITDGLVEARTETETMLGWEGLAALAAERVKQSANTETIADGILEDARAFAGQRQINDDIALLVARIHAS